VEAADAERLARELGVEHFFANTARRIWTLVEG
jgi:hypothetical protein